MSVVVSERRIEDTRYTSNVTVSPSGGKFVKVKWHCGEEYHFDVPELRQHIENIKTLAGVEAWYEGKDRYSKPFRVRLIDGRLHALDGRQAVDFADLRRAVKLTVKGMR